jgi:endo-1,3-1,4-beta-glycanase ExoK
MTRQSRILPNSQRTSIKRALCYGLAASFAAVLSGCASQTTGIAGVNGAESAASRDKAGFRETFRRSPHPADWYIANYTPDGQVQDVAWSHEQVGISRGGLALDLEPAVQSRWARAAGLNFVSGEIQRHERTHHGRYEIVMQAGRGAGLLTTFMTHTGPYHGTPYEEISVGIPGRDTRQAKLRVVHDGNEAHTESVDLDFDAAAGFHIYAFEWGSEEVRFLIDDKPVHVLGREDGVAPPQSPANVVADLWAGAPSQYAWMGRPGADTRARARIACISFHVPDVPGPRCSGTSTLMASSEAP